MFVKKNKILLISLIKPIHFIAYFCFSSVFCKIKLQMLITRAKTQMQTKKLIQLFFLLFYPKNVTCIALFIVSLVL